MEITASLDVPVLLVMFNRPVQALKVFERVRIAKPVELYLAVDGPRPNQSTDNEAVMQCRAIEDLVDWPCKVYTLYREKNLGCKYAVSSAITWFFQQVDAGIILEDDCLPDPTFFEFCRVLLYKYADDPKVMHISGANLYGNTKWGPYSFFFSKIPHIWGWATWRRAWKLYDVTMQDYPAFRDAGGIDDVVTYSPSRSYWKAVLDNTHSGLIDTWDYQWIFSIWKYQGISIIPNQNLVSNTGFGEAATHTFGDSEFANLPALPIEVASMDYPPTITLDIRAMNYAFARFYLLPSWWRIKFTRLKKMFKFSK